MIIAPASIPFHASLKVIKLNLDMRLNGVTIDTNEDVWRGKKIRYEHKYTEMLSFMNPLLLLSFCLRIFLFISNTRPLFRFALLHLATTLI